MSKKLYPTDALKQAQEVLIAWEQIGPGLSLGPIKLEEVSAEIEAIHALKIEIIDLELTLIKLRNQRDAGILAVWDKAKRVRSGIKGLYGDDSTEYEMAGGKRLSDRKKARRVASPSS